MPILSIYVGESQISVLRFNSETDFSFANYPYAYPSDLLRENFNEEKFYSQVLKYLSKAHTLDLSADTILVGTVGGSGVPIKGAKVSDIGSSLSSIQNYFWALVENFTIITPQSFSSFYLTQKDLTFSQPVISNYLSNKSLYPHLLPSSPDTFKAEDILTKLLLSTTVVGKEGDAPLMFSGGRFTGFHSNPVATYLLALDLIRNSGIYKVSLDVANKLPAIGLLNHHLNSKTSSPTVNENTKEEVTFLSDDLMMVNNEEVFADEFIKMGTVLYAPGEVECLFEKDAGNSQFVEIKSDKIFIFPLERTESARIVVDGKAIDHIETNVTGGKLGFVIDTRDKSSTDFLSNSSTRNSGWVKIINERISAF